MLILNLSSLKRILLVYIYAPVHYSCALQADPSIPVLVPGDTEIENMKQVDQRGGILYHPKVAASLVYAMALHSSLLLMLVVVNSCVTFKSMYYIIKRYV